MCFSSLFKKLEEKHKFKGETVKTNLTASKAAASLTFITHKWKWWSPKWFVMFLHLPTEPFTVLDLDLPQNFASWAFSQYLLLMWKTNSMSWRLQNKTLTLIPFYVKLWSICVFVARLCIWFGDQTCRYQQPEGMAGCPLLQADSHSKIIEL